jgi:hypothetical protein
VDDRILALGEFPRERPGDARQAARGHPQGVGGVLVGHPERRGEVGLAEAGYPQLGPHAQRDGCGDDHRGGGGGAAGGHHREHGGGVRAAPVDVVDHDQPGPGRGEVTGRGVEVERVRLAIGVAGQPDHQVLWCLHVAQQLSPDQASGLTFGRIGAQDLEPAVSGLRGGDLGQRRLARAGRPGDRKQPAGTARGAFQQAADLLQLTAAASERHILWYTAPVRRLGIPPRLGMPPTCAPCVTAVATSGICLQLWVS